jgi:predicted transposase/invertase (TIGR01784 family)
MNNLFKRRRFLRELKRLAKENAGQGKPLSLMDNIAFKILLASETKESHEALRYLLSACTRREVSSVQVKNSELLPAHLGGKTPRLDVNVTFNDGEAANLEMQIDKTSDDLRDRAAFYAAMLQAVQSRKGHSYKEIKRVYQVFFLNCVLYPQSDKLPRRYFYMEEKEHDRLTEASEIIFYEMPKLEQRLRGLLAGTTDINTLSKEEEWCIYMKYRHEERAAKLIAELSCKEEGMMWAERAAKKIDRDYDKARRRMNEIKDSMDEAQRRYDEEQRRRDEEQRRYNAREEGLREGRAEGMQQGMQQGREEGHAEGKVETARNFKALGIPADIIAKATGMSPEEIAKL